jgi:hypothetical protein
MPLIDIRTHGIGVAPASSRYGVFMKNEPFAEKKVAIYLEDISPYVVVAESENYLVYATPASDYNGNYNLVSCVNLKLYNKKTGDYIRDFTGALSSAYGYSLKQLILDEELDRFFVMIYKNYPAMSPQFGTYIRVFRISDGTKLNDILIDGESPQGMLVTEDKRFLAVSHQFTVEFRDINNVNNVVWSKNTSFIINDIVCDDGQYVYHLDYNGSQTMVRAVKYSDNSWTTIETTENGFQWVPITTWRDIVNNKVYLLTSNYGIWVLDASTKTFSLVTNYGDSNTMVGNFRTIPRSKKFLDYGFIHSQGASSLWFITDTWGTPYTLGTPIKSLPTQALNGWLKMYHLKEFNDRYIGNDRTITFNLITAINTSPSRPNTILKATIKQF